jgi:hypothetical protein
MIQAHVGQDFFLPIRIVQIWFHSLNHEQLGRRVRRVHFTFSEIKSKTNRLTNGQRTPHRRRVTSDSK